MLMKQRLQGGRTQTPLVALTQQLLSTVEAEPGPGVVQVLAWTLHVRGLVRVAEPHVLDQPPMDHEDQAGVCAMR